MDQNKIKLWIMIGIGFILCCIGAYLILSNVNSYSEFKTLTEMKAFAMTNNCTMEVNFNQAGNYEATCVPRAKANSKDINAWGVG